MPDPGPTTLSVGLLGLLSLVLAMVARRGGVASVPPSLRGLWGFFVLLAVADWLSFRISIWLFAFWCFLALREYFSLTDLRGDDRPAILGAYLSIPFMMFFVHIHWYGMFIISIPVFIFLLIPLLATHGEARGAVFSIGAIDLGLFLFVYCPGHIAYLSFFSVRMTLMFLVAAALSGAIARLLVGKHPGLVYALSVAATTGFTLLVSPWTAIPAIHSAALGALIPFLVISGNRTLRALERDLGITPERLESGRGLFFDSLRAYLFSAPPVFHYLRWFLDWGSL